MKKKFLSIILCGILLLTALAGCSTSQPDVQPTEQTVNLEEMGFTLLEPTQEQREQAIPVGSTASYMYSAQTLEQLCTNSVAAVRGTIVQQANTTYDGNAYHVYAIQVEEAYFGSPQAGDTIVMLLAGGYVPLEDVIEANDSADRFSEIPQSEWGTTMVHQSVLGLEMPQAEEEYVFFLLDDNHFSGCYYPLCEGYGILRYDEGEGAFHRMLEDETGTELIQAQTVEAFDAQCVQVRTQVMAAKEEME